MNAVERLRITRSVGIGLVRRRTRTPVLHGERGRFDARETVPMLLRRPWPRARPRGTRLPRIRGHDERRARAEVRVVVQPTAEGIYSGTVTTKHSSRAPSFGRWSMNNQYPLAQLRTATDLEPTITDDIIHETRSAHRNMSPTMAQGCLDEMPPNCLPPR